MKRHIIGGGILTAVGLFTLAACSSTTTDTGQPLGVELTADRTNAAVGDSIEFFAQGSGSLLAGMAIEYGDGAADSLSTEGAVTATMRRKHAYSEPGSYLAVATLADGTFQGLVLIKDTVEIEITGGL